MPGCPPVRKAAPFCPIQEHRTLSLELLNACEAYQVLRDIALGIRTARGIDALAAPKPACGLMTFDADGWLLTLYIDSGALAYCERCQSPDGRMYLFDTRQPYGTGPVELLSGWEHAQMEHLLNNPLPSSVKPHAVRLWFDKDLIDDADWIKRFHITAIQLSIASKNSDDSILSVSPSRRFPNPKR